MYAHSVQRSEIDAQLKSHLLFICGFGKRILLRRHIRAYIVPAVALQATVTDTFLYTTVRNDSFNKHTHLVYYGNAYCLKIMRHMASCTEMAPVSYTRQRAIFMSALLQK
jgi:hypothetical protein